MINNQPSKCDFMYNDICNKIKESKSKGIIDSKLADDLILEIKNYGKQVQDDFVEETNRCLNAMKDAFCHND